MRRRLYALAILFFLTGGAKGAQVIANDADLPNATPSGTTFTVPKSWSLLTGNAQAVLTTPEGDTHIAIIDIPDAKDALAAAESGWALYRPDAHRPLRLSTPRAPREGWDQEVILEYETSPNEHLVVAARALLSGTHWTIAIADGTQATFEKRGAAASLVFNSLRPAGYHRETFAGRAPHPLDASRVAALKSFVKTSMQSLGIPGTAMALIDHGRVVFESGLGVRELGKPTPVDANTLFMIASNTKGMTTLLLAKLVDEGKLSWDQPVTEVYPSFRLGNDATTRKVLIRHLVCACTGLPRKDFDWLFNTRKDTPASTTFQQLASTEPTSGFGEVFQYNNLMASAAGYIGGHLVHPEQELGAAYDAAMQEKIFAPLGMTATTFDIKRALSGNHASPHGDDIDGKPTVARMDINYAIQPYRPAGGAWSSAHDLIEYVRDELTQGKLPDGTQLVSPENLLIRRSLGVPTGEDSNYGMGFETIRKWGVPVVHHGGSLSGFKSDVIFLPDAQIGAVILTNAESGDLMLRPFMRRLLEITYDGKLEAAGDVATAATNYRLEIAKMRERLVYPPTKDVSARLAGSYASPELGGIKVLHDKGGIIFDFGLWKSHVASRKNDDGTTSLLTVDPTKNGGEFVISTRDRKRMLLIHDHQHEYVYTEVK